MCIVNHLSETYLNFSKTNSVLPHIIVVFGTCSLVVVSTLRLVVDPIEGIHILLDCVPLRPHLADEPDHSNSLEEEEKEENSRQVDEESVGLACLKNTI